MYWLVVGICIIVGFFGYSFLEYIMFGIYDVKGDVYSFGVVMFEFIIGCKFLDRGYEFFVWRGVYYFLEFVVFVFVLFDVCW